MSSIPGGSPLSPSEHSENAATASAIGGRTPDVGFEQSGSGRGGGSPVDGYAEAIVAVASAEGVIDRVDSELYAFAQAVEGHPELSQRLSDPALDNDTKNALIGDLLNRAHPQTIAAVNYIINAGRGRQLTAIAHGVVERAASRRSSALAEVRTAVPLDDQQRQRLVAALSAQEKRPVEVRVTVDPTIVGGIVVTIGDTVIDGSLARRLADARSQLVGA